jgi:hypothetical protein
MNGSDREELERIANVKPTRLERRMAKSQLKMMDMMDAADDLGAGSAGKAVLGVLGLIGIIAALIPTIIGFGLLMIPLLMLYTCVSHF